MKMAAFGLHECNRWSSASSIDRFPLSAQTLRRAIFVLFGLLTLKRFAERGTSLDDQNLERYLQFFI